MMLSQILMKKMADTTEERVARYNKAHPDTPIDLSASIPKSVPDTASQQKLGINPAMMNLKREEAKIEQEIMERMEKEQLLKNLVGATAGAGLGGYAGYKGLEALMPGNPYAKYIGGILGGLGGGYLGGASTQKLQDYLGGLS